MIIPWLKKIFSEDGSIIMSASACVMIIIGPGNGLASNRQTLETKLLIMLPMLKMWSHHLKVFIHIIKQKTNKDIWDTMTSFQDIALPQDRFPWNVAQTNSELSRLSWKSLRTWMYVSPAKFNHMTGRKISTQRRQRAIKWVLLGLARRERRATESTGLSWKSVDLIKSHTWEALCFFYLNSKHGE